jgi:hypothetical protein
MNATELMLHPVRMRIMAALAGGRDLTTTQVCARLPDVSRVTVYRQIAQLVEGGCIEIAGEQRVRGAVERRYRLRQDRPTINTDMAAEMTAEDHRNGFAAALAVLIAEFNSYLDGGDANPATDGVGYRQAVLWLSPDEFTALIHALLSTLQPAIANAPAPDRTPYLLSPIVFPLAGDR